MRTSGQITFNFLKILDSFEDEWDQITSDLLVCILELPYKNDIRDGHPDHDGHHIQGGYHGQDSHYSRDGHHGLYDRHIHHDDHQSHLG